MINLDPDKDYALRLIEELRDNGFVAEMDYYGRSLKAQFKSSDRKKARFVLIIGEDEIKEGKVSLKDMVKGEQAMYAVPEAAAIIKAGKSERGTEKCVLSAE